jgi:hypothetical protein
VSLRPALPSRERWPQCRLPRTDRPQLRFRRRTQAVPAAAALGQAVVPQAAITTIPSHEPRTGRPAEKTVSTTCGLTERHSGMCSFWTLATEPERRQFQPPARSRASQEALRNGGNPVEELSARISGTVCPISAHSRPPRPPRLAAMTMVFLIETPQIEIGVELTRRPSIPSRTPEQVWGMADGRPAISGTILGIPQAATSAHASRCPPMGRFCGHDPNGETRR